MPERVQLSRRKGWRMPPNTVSVARPGRHGNPFYIGGYHKIGDGKQFSFARITACPGYEDESFTFVETREQAVSMFAEYRRIYPLSERDREELRGKNLACWCPLDQPCHADVLLELANQPSNRAV
jgi:hypothetical protein